MTLSLKALDDLKLSLRQDFCFDFVDAKFSRYSLRVRAAVAGQHDHADAVLLKHLNGFSGGLFYRVGDREEPGGLPVNDNEHGGLAVSAKCLSVANQFAGADAELFEQLAVAKRHRVAIHLAGHAPSRQRTEFLASGEPKPPLAGSRQNR